jgi:hypothetical protein
MKKENKADIILKNISIKNLEVYFLIMEVLTCTRYIMDELLDKKLFKKLIDKTI